MLHVRSGTSWFQRAWIQSPRMMCAFSPATCWSSCAQLSLSSDRKRRDTQQCVESASTVFAGLQNAAHPTDTWSLSLDHLCAYQRGPSDGAIAGPATYEKREREVARRSVPSHNACAQGRWSQPQAGPMVGDARQGISPAGGDTRNFRHHCDVTKNAIPHEDLFRVKAHRMVPRFRERSSRIISVSAHVR